MFVHLLPEIAERRSAITETTESPTAIPAAERDHSLFIVALAGFVTFYGLEQLAHHSRRDTDHEEVAGGAETQTSASIFWIHIGSFAAYNALIGYLLLHREETGVWPLLLYFTAMALHFVVNDPGLREHHQDTYEQIGRWVLAGAVFVGLLIGYVTRVQELLLSLLVAFLAGGIILNVIKEELPEDRKSRFRAFGTGLIVYTIISLLI